MDLATTELATQDDVRAYWLGEVGPEGWYKADPALDAAIARRFRPTWEAARGDGLNGWSTGPEGALAYLVLTDQFPRNMFRDDPRAFATDARARAAACHAIAQGWDMAVPEPARQFFYLPLEHSEFQTDQDRAVRLIRARMPETGAETLRHARAHREVIRSFGRFPFRNAALSRQPRPGEEAFLEKGGYGAALRALEA